MKNQANPLKPIKSFEILLPKMNKRQRIDYYLSPNEFKNDNDRFGLFSKDVDPDTFLSTESINSETNDKWLASYPNSTKKMPGFSLTF